METNCGAVGGAFPLIRNQYFSLFSGTPEKMVARAFPKTCLSKGSRGVQLTAGSCSLRWSRWLLWCTGSAPRLAQACAVGGCAPNCRLRDVGFRSILIYSDKECGSRQQGCRGGAFFREGTWTPNRRPQRRRKLALNQTAWGSLKFLATVTMARRRRVR